MNKSQIPYNAYDKLLSAEHLKKRGDKLAIIENKRTFSYMELNEYACRFANFLEHKKLRQKRIILALSDQAEFHICFLGALKASVIPVPINPMLSTNDCNYIISDSQAKLVVGLSTIEKKISGLMPPVNSKGCKLKPEFLNESILLAVLSNYSSDHVTVATYANTPAFWLYTSGTTGKPKGVVHKHESLALTAELYAKGTLAMSDSDIVYSTAKLYFAYGLGNSLTFPLYCGATVILCSDRPKPDVISDLLIKFKPTLFFSVPTIFNSLINSESLNKSNFVSLRFCISAGETLPQALYNQFKDMFGLSIIEGIGTTELLHIFISNCQGQAVPGTSGIPTKGTIVKLIDKDGKEVSDGEIGDLTVKSKHSALGYWCNELASQKTFQNDWVITGDKFKKEQGVYIYCGRSDDLFKVKGQYISPYQIENCLLLLPFVIECAVVGIENRDNLMSIHAFIVTENKSNNEQKQAEIKRHVSQHLSKNKVPSQIQFVSSLPKTSTGKIQRYKLKNYSK